MNECLFCNRAKLGKVLYEDDFAYVIADIHPAAPVHLLIITKIHYKSLNEMPVLQGNNFFTTLSNVVNTFSLSNYSIIINTGLKAGQIINHIHMHVKSWN